MRSSHRLEGNLENPCGTKVCVLPIMGFDGAEPEIWVSKSRNKQTMNQVHGRCLGLSDRSERKWSFVQRASPQLNYAYVVCIIRKKALHLESWAAHDVPCISDWWAFVSILKPFQLHDAPTRGHKDLPRRGFDPSPSNLKSRARCMKHS